MDPVDEQVAPSDHEEEEGDTSKGTQGQPNETQSTQGRRTQGQQKVNPELLKLKRRAVGIEFTISTLFDKVDAYSKDPSKVELSVIKSDLDNVKRLKDGFSDLSMAIYAVCETDQQARRESLTLGVVNECLDKINETLCKLEQEVGPDDASRGFKGIKLPDLELPTFDGKYEDWPSYRDLINAYIVNNRKYSGSEKLGHLKPTLKGEAEDIIRNIECTNINFEDAWDLIKSRYENKREIVMAIVRRLINSKPLADETPSQLRKLIDTFNESCRSLKAMKVPVDNWNEILVVLLVERLPSETRREWTKSLKGTDVPILSEVQEFLEDYLRGLLIITKSSSTTNKGDQKNNQSSKSKSHASSTSTQEKIRKCPMCTSSEHGLYKCDEFLQLAIQERGKFVRGKNLCYNCLSSTHKADKCRSKYSCFKCKKRHHTILHLEKPVEEKKEDAPIQASSSATASHHSTSARVLLSTALVNVIDSNGDVQGCRVLLDQGSESNMITEQCFKRLGLRRHSCDVTITGVSGATVGKALGETSLQLTSRVSKFKLDVNALILPKVTGFLPSFNCEKVDWPHIKGLKLADHNFVKPREVDILIGAEFVAALKTGKKAVGPPSTPIAEETEFGWVISGPVGALPRSVSVNHAQAIEDTISKFWEIEAVPDRPFFTKEEKECERHFLSHHSRSPNGRYQVGLPFKSNFESLGASRTMALKRFYNLERRLELLPEFKDTYRNFMQEYEDLGHMEPVPESQCGELVGKTNYLPHHFVLKESSSTTKLRVVFDGSAKTSTGVSLNECLMVGPTIQRDIFSHLLSFRCNAVALKADITKMYRQFEVSKSDMDFQRIFWRNNQGQVKEYRLKTVTYGTSCAPFLAVRCLKQIAIDYSSSFPRGAEILTNNHYVDDLMGGANSTADALQVYKELTEPLKCAGMEMRQWDSNNKEFLKSIPEGLRGKNSVLRVDSTLSKALGVCWDSETDVFHFGGYFPAKIDKASKRLILKAMARVFDPLGFLSPLTVSIKSFFQKLWQPIELRSERRLLTWDDEIPRELRQPWIDFEDGIPLIEKIKVPRLLFDSEDLVEIHGFSDASEIAYCGVIYVRCIGRNTISTNIITAKTRVAPLSQISLPRLELCGALLLSRLIPLVLEATGLKCPIYAYSDSETVLKWIRNTSRKFHTFTANRVAEIQETLPTESWRFVPGVLNPADLGTRGITAADLVTSDLWWKGPTFLREVTLPNFECKETNRGDEEFKCESKATHLVQTNCSFILRHSNLVRLKRVVAYVLRFISNCRLQSGSGERKVGDLTVEELNKAFQSCIIAVQRETYCKEIEALIRKEPLSRRSALLSLNPFLDGDGVLRVGGRLQNSTQPEEYKHPIILPAHHHFTNILIWHKHRSLHHASYQLLWSSLRGDFWIIKARSTIRQILRLCLKCKRLKAQTCDQLMGSLPHGRVNPSSPFDTTGLDFAGPFKAQETAGRGKKQFDVYFCVFICFSTKAIHLEAVIGLTTDAFIAALKRFVARRGLPTHIYSDRGTNFRGAVDDMKEWFQLLESANHEISSFLGNQGIQWHFNPSRAPHMGGLWEAGVKSAKYHLKRIVGATTLTLEEFTTMLSLVEAVLNSRPLFAMSPDPNDYEVLTPGHFLIGRPLTSIPEPSLSHLKENRLSRWQRVQQMLGHFWTRWKSDYLNTLQERHKWKSPSKNVAVGDLVLIKDDDLPPLKWKMARISAVFPGADQLVRAVEVKTITSNIGKDGKLTNIKEHIYTRPIVKICPLIPNSDQNN